MERPPKQYTQEEIVGLEKSRAISEASLLIDGAEYKHDEKGEKKLDVTNMSKSILEYEEILHSNENLSEEEQELRVANLLEKESKDAIKYDQEKLVVVYFDDNNMLKSCRVDPFGTGEYEGKYGYPEIIDGKLCVMNVKPRVGRWPLNNDFQPHTDEIELKKIVSIESSY